MSQMSLLDPSDEPALDLWYLEQLRNMASVPVSLSPGLIAFIIPVKENSSKNSAVSLKKASSLCFTYHPRLARAAIRLQSRGDDSQSCALWYARYWFANSCARFRL